MKIYSLTKVLILPLVLMAIAIFYYADRSGNDDFTIWLFVPAVLLTVVLIFGPQIDYWWHTKYPVPLDPRIKSWLQRYFLPYQELEPSQKTLFEKRLSLYMEAREFKSVGSEMHELPEDLKGIIGSIPIMLTMGKEDFLMGEYNRIYLYKHPFPSPAMQFLHSVEVNREDGILLFSLEHLLPGITRSREFFNIGLYGFAQVFIDVFQPALPPGDQITWEWIERVSDYREKDVKAITGLQDLEMQAVLLTCFLVFPEKFKAIDDDLYHQMHKII